MYLDMFRQCLTISKQCLDIFVMPTMFSMAPLHLLGHNDQNKVKHDIFSHVMPLVPVLLSCEGTCIISGVTLFIRLRQLKQGTTYFFWSCDAVGTTVNIKSH